MEHNRDVQSRVGQRVKRRVVTRALMTAMVGGVIGASAVNTPAATYNSKHYRIQSDLDASVTREYALRLDAMYEEYARRLADFDTPSDKRFEVHLFKHRSDYVKFTGNRVPNSAGMFIPSQHALAGYEESQGRAGLRQTLQHEAFHQFAWETISKNLPIWLDEGLAQVFEEGVWTGNQFMLGQVPPDRIQDLQEDIRDGRFIPFRDLLKMSREDFQYRMRDPKWARAEYNQSWAMTHFLVFVETPDGRPRFRARLLTWLSDMHAGRDPAVSFAGNFSPNVDGFEARFLEWVASLKPTPISVYSYRMTRLAELLRLFKTDGREFQSADALRQYLSKGRFQLTEKRGGQTYTREENALTYMNDLSDKPWSSSQLMFERRSGEMPDILLKPPNLSPIRVRFVKNGSELSPELIFESR